MIGAGSAATSGPERLSLFPLRQIWTLSLNTRTTASPAFGQTWVYFPLANDQLAAYDVASGRQVWTIAASVTTEPALGEGLLFAGDKASVAAIRVADGTVGWRTEVDGPLAQPPVWDNGWLIVATAPGTLYAFRASDGEVIWQKPMPSKAHARAALAADRVYVPTEDGRVIAYAVETGEVVWDRRLGGPANDILALDERLYFGANDKFFYCLDTADGIVKWRWRTGGDVVGLPALDNRRVYYISLDNLLRAHDRKTGNQIWKRPLPFRPITGPIRANDVILVSGLTQVKSYRLTDGMPAQDVATSGEVSFAPHVVVADTLLTPFVVVLTRDIAKGETVTAFTRSLDPAVSVISPLPNAIQVSPPVEASAKPPVP